MQITLMGDYALRTMLQMAVESEDSIIPIQKISAWWQIPEKFLRKIIPLLVQSGLIRTFRGNKGGIQIAKSADQITAKDIVEAVEGPIALSRCLIIPSKCERDSWCPVHTLWLEAQNQLVSVLSSKTLADLANTGISKVA